MTFSLTQFFTDPLLYPSTIGSMLMCLTSSLAGVLLFVRKRTLIGEALSHAAYPGVVLSVLIGSTLFPHLESLLSLFVLFGAFVFALLGYFLIEVMEKKWKASPDSALCFTLSSMLGLGIFIASRVQMTHPLWYKQIQVFLYGQAATMMPYHVWLYATLATLVIGMIILLYHPLKVLHFDPQFSRSIGLSSRLLQAVSIFLLTLSVVIGIRSVGVVLMSGMLIAPAAAARYLTHRFSHMFFIAGAIGLVSGFAGSYLSAVSGSMPTGPLILCVALSICVCALLFGSKKGILVRVFHVLSFRGKTQMENALKTLWKGKQIDSSQLFIKWQLTLLGHVKQSKDGLKLTGKGLARALKIVRHHRLWEVYLHDIGIHSKDLHRQAEEMEHAITPEMEQTLTDVLGNPSKDPHEQPIPTRGDA